MTLIDDKRILRGAMLAWRGGLERGARRRRGGLVETWPLERPFETPAVVSGFWPMAEDSTSAR
jgi:5-formyltetrahydrofolate cyclo-ligase